jgi:hypothetical protein
MEYFSASSSLAAGQVTRDGGCEDLDVKGGFITDEAILIAPQCLEIAQPPAIIHVIVECVAVQSCQVVEDAPARRIDKAPQRLVEEIP